MALALVIIVSFRKFYLRILLNRKFLAKPRYATFQKKSLKIAHIYNQTMSWEGGCNLAPQAHGTLLFLSPCCMLPFPSSVFLLKAKIFVWEIELLGSKKFCCECRRDPQFLGVFFGGEPGFHPKKKTKSPPKKKKSGFNGKCVTHFPFTIPRTLNKHLSLSRCHCRCIVYRLHGGRSTPRCSGCAVRLHRGLTLIPSPI